MRPITPEEKNQFVKTTLKTLENLCLRKGGDYDRTNDGLAIFRDASDELGLSPLQVWSVFMRKHWGAILQYLRTGEAHAECIHERLLDLSLFAILGSCIIEEENLVRAEEKDLSTTLSSELE